MLRDCYATAQAFAAVKSTMSGPSESISDQNPGHNRDTAAMNSATPGVSCGITPSGKFCMPRRAFLKSFSFVG